VSFLKYTLQTYYSRRLNRKSITTVSLRRPPPSTHYCVRMLLNAGSRDVDVTRFAWIFYRDYQRSRNV